MTREFLNNSPILSTIHKNGIIFVIRLYHNCKYDCLYSTLYVKLLTKKKRKKENVIVTKFDTLTGDILI